MAEPDFFTTKNPKIIEFIRANKLLNFENLILQTIDDYSNQKSGNVLITMNEVTHIHQEYQNILNCKKFFENMIKDIRTNNYKIKSPTIENFCAKHLNIKQEVFSFALNRELRCCRFFDRASATPQSYMADPFRFPRNG